MRRAMLLGAPPDAPFVPRKGQSGWVLTGQHWDEENPRSYIGWVWQARAGPGRAGRAGPNRAWPGRAWPGRAEPGRAGAGRAGTGLPGRAAPGRACRDEPGRAGTGALISIHVICL